jgi:hypothetical protein
MYTNNPNSSVRVKYAIVHITKGRIRIRIPKLKYDREYQCCLKKLVESLRFVTGVRINPAAQSIVIHYDEWAWTFVSLQKKLAVAIQEAANIDVLVPTSVQNTRSFQNGSSKERVSLPKNVNFSLDSTSSNFLKSKFKAVNVQSPQKPVVKNSDNSIESNGFFVPPHFSTTERKTYSSNSSPNTDKRFRIVFLQTTATASPLRSSKHEKIVDYKQLSQQIQTIHRTRGKILSVNAIA